MSSLTKYEDEQVRKIREWKIKEPSVMSKTFGKVAVPVTWLVQKIIPHAAIRSAIDVVNSAGKWLSDAGDIKRNGMVSEIQNLRNKDLELSDKLANSVHNWAIGMAAAEGAATGFGGIFAIAADIPVIVTLALRTIHKIGLCYGYESIDDNDNQFILGILAASGANSVEEKVAALTMLRSIEVTIAKQTWKAMAEKAAKRQISKEGAIIAIKNLAKQIGINITKRKALQAIPVIGALVGGSVNGWYIKDVGWAARRPFQERWLIDNQKILEV
ncbi:MAG: EcsC protein family protein [Candidatus Brocadia sinica]|nr:MAG: EcsC protein family protein [Candidatus Brocadia sinica]